VHVRKRRGASSLPHSLFVRLLRLCRRYSLELTAKVFVWTVVMGLLAARQAEMAEAVVSWSRLPSPIAMIDSLAWAQGVAGLPAVASAKAGSNPAAPTTFRVSG